MLGCPPLRADVEGYAYAIVLILKANRLTDTNKKVKVIVFL